MTSPAGMVLEAALAALAAVHQVDEAKDLRDKMVALQAYARQAKDLRMHAWVTEIRLRAERRTGELLREMPKQAGARGVGKKVGYPGGQPTLLDLGVSHRESSLWQRVAALPEAEFERRLRIVADDPRLATTKRLLRNPMPHRHRARVRRAAGADVGIVTARADGPPFTGVLALEHAIDLFRDEGRASAEIANTLRARADKVEREEDGATWSG